jgi:TatD DNase family protein
MASKALPRIFDTHCHIGLIRREREPIPASLLGSAIGPLPASLAHDATTKCLEAFRHNVPRLMIIGICDKTSRQAAHVAGLIQQQAAAAPQPQSVWSGYSVGIHPHNAQKFDAMWPTVSALAWDGCQLTDDARTILRPVAIGETGLDYFKSTGSAVEQKRNLKAHVELAAELNLPVIVHCRDAYDDLFQCLDNWGIKQLRGVLHCFASGVHHMRCGVERGFKISFCGTLTYPKSRQLREACLQCPATSIVFETDSPFLPPQSNRGSVNCPHMITEVVDCAAKIRGVDSVTMADIAWKNSCELFQIPQ